MEKVDKNSNKQNMEEESKTIDGDESENSRKKSQPEKKSILSRIKEIKRKLEANNNSNEEPQSKIPKLENTQEKEDTVTTLPEYLEKERSLEEEANYQASFDWGNENCCTYDSGYITQPVYACATCSKSSKNQFGFCYGCSMNCHIGKDHVVYELFDKRDFKCDCGTPRSGCKCIFGIMREVNNTENIYNHNFDGLYCWCNSKYNDAEDIMYQCILCMDWYHQECINEHEKANEIPDEEVSSDFICKDCVHKYPFFASYYESLLYPEPSFCAKLCANLEEIPKDSNSSCKRSLVNEEAILPFLNSIFLQEHWDDSLCKCVDCMNMYQKNKLQFLVEDEKKAEEETEKTEEGNLEEQSSLNDNNNDNNNNSPNSQENQPNTKINFSLDSFIDNALSSIPYSQSLLLAEKYRELKTELSAYFKTFAERNLAITSQDIYRFFADLKKKNETKEQ